MDEKIIQRNCSFGCFYYAFMGENKQTGLGENWEVTDNYSR